MPLPTIYKRTGISGVLNLKSAAPKRGKRKTALLQRCEGTAAIRNNWQRLSASFQPG